MPFSESYQLLRHLKTFQTARKEARQELIEEKSQKGLKKHCNQNVVLNEEGGGNRIHCAAGNGIRWPMTQEKSD